MIKYNTFQLLMAFAAHTFLQYLLHFQKNNQYITPFQTYSSVSLQMALLPKYQFPS